MKAISRFILSTSLFLLPFVSSGLATSCAIKQPQETVGQYVDGSVISSQVKAKILADKKLRGTTISVKTYKNTVQLSGFVHNLSQKIRAEQIAASVDNVGNVDNALLIQR